jgi:single-strand DNA-binding protein
MRDQNSLNKVILIGRIGQRPELRHLPQADRSVARFTMATNERSFNPQTNQATIKTEWHSLYAWGKLAEFCDRFLEVGKQILIEGKLRTRSWQDRDGNKRKTTEIEAFNIVLLGSRDSQSQGPRGDNIDAPYRDAGHDAPAADFPADEEPVGPIGEDDVPF